MKEKSHHQIGKGIACIIASAFFFALMNVFVRLAGDLPVYEKSMFRNLVAFIIAGCVIAFQKQDFTYPKKYWKDLFFRSLLGTVGIIGNYYAIDHLILADASAIQKLVPFISVLFSFVLLKEKIRGYQIFCITGAFLSSLLVIRPDFSGGDMSGALMAVLGAFGAGMAYVYVRKLSLQGLERNKIIFFFSGFSMLLMLPFALADFQWMSPGQVITLIGAGVMAALGQFAVTYAYSYAPAARISIFDYIQILFSALLGFFFFGQIPDNLSVIGYFLILAWIIALRFHKGIKKEQKALEK